MLITKLLWSLVTAQPHVVTSVRAQVGEGGLVFTSSFGLSRASGLSSWPGEVEGRGCVVAYEPLS